MRSSRRSCTAPSHYLKPRFTGRTLTDGWLDPAMLYRIPRNLQTTGLRMFGRLAFCDHYRPLMGKIHTAIDTMVAADAMTQTEGWTGLLRRTNRPRVYVVAGLGGGTGGGMFLDIAYSVQNRLRRMGYDSPDVVGVLVAPPADPQATPQQALANTYASLTELHHYSRPDTRFVANYDERLGLLEERVRRSRRCSYSPASRNRATRPPAATATARSGRTPPTILPPSSRAVAMPGSRVIAKPGSRVIANPGSRVMPALATQREVDPATALKALKPYADAAELIRVNLFEPLGRAIDEARAAAEPAPNEGLTAFGIAGYSWPRAEVVARTSARVARTMLKRWSSSNSKRTREIIPGLAQKHWTQLGLDPETLQAQLQLAADRAAGAAVEEKIAALLDPLAPADGSRLPEPERVSVALDRVAKMIGVPGSGTRRPAGACERAIGAAAVEIASGAGLDLHAEVPGLVDDPKFRLSGAEEMLRQFHATTDRLVERKLLEADEQEAKAKTAYDFLSQYCHFQKGTRKPTANEFTEALKRYPKMQYQAQLSRSLGGVYHALKKVLAEQLAAVSAARQRLEVAGPSNPAVEPEAVPERPLDSRQLMPPGCSGVGQAVEWFIGTLTEGDFNEIDHRVQMWIEPKYGTVFQACLNSMSGPDDVLRAVYEETRLHLEAKLGAGDFAAMFTERHHTPRAAEKALSEVFHEAEPGWVARGPGRPMR